MKQVAGSLKLELAQYRELAAFAQFGSDLDKATQETLARGARLTQLLKQGQYEPMPVERQVIQIYAATNRDDPNRRGWLRDVPETDVGRWAKDFLAFIDARYPQIPKDIIAKRELTAETKTKLNQALTEFNEIFEPSKPS
jgi:F-type H+-transporting ATPase subunit alpha